jgi:hypothetical protein
MGRLARSKRFDSTKYLAFDGWRSNSAMSSTFTFSPPCVPAMPSVIMFEQNGQALASVRAPVAMASSERKTRTRCDGGSSNHLRSVSDFSI